MLQLPFFQIPLEKTRPGVKSAFAVPAPKTPLSRAIEVPAPKTPPHAAGSDWVDEALGVDAPNTPLDGAAEEAGDLSWLDADLAEDSEHAESVGWEVAEEEAEPEAPEEAEEAEPDALEAGLREEVEETEPDALEECDISDGERWWLE